MDYELLLLFGDELERRGGGSYVERVLDSGQQCPIEALCGSHHIHAIILVGDFELD